VLTYVGGGMPPSGVFSVLLGFYAVIRTVLYYWKSNKKAILIVFSGFAVAVVLGCFSFRLMMWAYCVLLGKRYCSGRVYSTSRTTLDFAY
jgi:hypothetical protein